MMRDEECESCKVLRILSKEIFLVSPGSEVIGNAQVAPKKKKIQAITMASFHIINICV